MEYKNTLNLPQTEFPMRANLPQREPGFVENWKASGLYERLQAHRSGAPSFVLHDGPPYANGNIHIGHALNKVLKDFVVKFKTMAGYRAPYRPGWDCHGLPIELEVEKKLGRAKKAAMDTAAVRRLCHEYADRYVGIQREEFRRLGVLGDWDRPYLTKDPAYEAREVREFAKVIAAGGLYRGRKPVHWCASCRTALAEAEVDYEDHRSTSVYVAFPLTTLPDALAEFAHRNPAIAIWTTTPWTLPANLAVAVHPRFQYALVEAGERTLVVARDMVEDLRDRLGLGRILATVEGAALDRCEVRHPWLDRKSLVILGEHVTLEAGTGCVHTAPGHGHDDYVVGQRYGLDTYAPVDDAGRFSADVAEFAGEFVFDADAGVVALLETRGALLARQEIEHSYPHCWRCKKPIIFRATDQWFLSMDHADLRVRTLEQIDAVRWIPQWGRERIYGMIGNRPDWCLSRQRSWGVPVVAVQCRSCDKSVTTESLALHVAELFEAAGSDVWFARELRELIPSDFRCPECGGNDFERVSDILDVWFDSGVSFAAVVEADHGEATLADLYLEGSDQHRGWFHSALLTAVATRGRAPYRAVLTHGFVLDGNGRKMSKSEGNVVAPEQVIKQYGADILRLWVAAEDYRDDVRISDEILKRLADSYRRIRNTARNLLGNLYDFEPSTNAVSLDAMEPLDRWALTRLDALVERCRKAYDSYEFHVVYHALNNFCSVDMSALYFDIVKDRLYCSGRDSLERRSAQTVMYEVLRALTGVIAPILSFTAEEIWGAIPCGERSPSVFLSDFPRPDPAWRSEAVSREWERLWEIRAVVTKALEDDRKAGRIGHSLDARVVVEAGDSDHALLCRLTAPRLAAIWIVSQVDVIQAAGDSALTVRIEAPRGGKCGRCWNYSEAVGRYADHPEICDRCHDVVARP